MANFNYVLNCVNAAAANAAAGFRNRIINGDMRIDQRNAGAAQTFIAAAPIAYSVDRFYGFSTGGAPVGQRVPGTGSDQYLYQFTGAASTSVIAFGQRIESTNIYDLANTTATFSVELANSLLTTVTWTAYYPNSLDNWSARTQIATGTFTVNSALTRYSTQIALGANAGNGVTIELSVGAQISGTWKIGQFQLEPGAVMTTFERRPIATELALSQRYYEVDLSGNTIWSGMVTSGSPYYMSVRFAVTKRANPTVTTAYTVNSAFPSTSSPTPAGLNPTSFQTTLFANATASVGYYQFTWKADSEL